MKKMFCRQLLACFCLVGVAFTSPAFAAYDGPKFSFRVAHTTPPGNHITLAFEKFKELVEKKSDGRISVQIFPNAMLGSDRVLMEGAQKGSLEMAVSSTPNMANFSPLYQIFDLPYITSPQNQEKLYAAIDSGELGKYLVKVAHDIALEPIMYAEYGYRNFVTIKKPISSVKDLAGLKIRTTDSPVEVEVAKALGMNPTPVAWGETYTALQQGIVDAMESPLTYIIPSKFYEVQDYLSMTNHFYSPSVVAMNKAKFEALTPEQQEIMLSCAEQATAYQTEFCLSMDEKLADEAANIHGMEVVYTDMEEFREATQVVYDNHPEYAEILAEISAVK